MARTANRYLETDAGTDKIRKKNLAGDYLRLSKDSDYTGSDSLENQRRIAKEYESSHPDLKIVREYVDDGKTGTDFKRPAFIRMIDDLRQGIIDCVIVKDLSRFGREYLETSNYIERVFPFLGTRFISLCDGYDSADPYSDKELLMISLKNLMHELYAKDISKKEGSIYKMKQENGIFYRSAAIPYGYQMNEQRTNYVICEDAAAVVKLIFQSYAQNMSKHAITQILNERKILTPAQYMEAGRVHGNDGDDRRLWNLSTVDRILKNPIYIGNVVRHKTVQSLAEGISCKRVPGEEQVIIENNHPAIISRELFDIVQKKLDQTKAVFTGYREVRAYDKQTEGFDRNIFQGKLFCGNCMAAMVRTGAYRVTDEGRIRYKVYKCSTHRNWVGLCDSRYIEEKVLCVIIFETIKKQLQFIKKIKSIIEKDVRYSFESCLQRIRRERQKIANASALLNREYLKVYSGHSEGTVDVASFQQFRKEYLNKTEFLKRQLQELENEENKADKARGALEKLLVDWSKFGRNRTLTEMMVETCVSRIELHSDNRVEITLAYQDCFRTVSDWIGKGAAN